MDVSARCALPTSHFLGQAAMFNREKVKKQFSKIVDINPIIEVSFSLSQTS